MELEKAALLAALTLTTWIALALLADRHGDPRVNRPLAALLFALCPPLAYFYTSTLTPGGWMWLGQLALAGIWIKGPLLRLLTGAAVGAPLRFAAWHFVPFAIAAAAMPAFPEWSRALGLAGLLHALCYQVISVCLLYRHRGRLVRIYRGYPNSSFYWLLFVITGLAVVMVLDFLLMGPGYISGRMPLGSIQVATIATTLYLLTVSLCSLYRPEVFFSITDLSSVSAEAPPLAQQPNAETPSIPPERTLRELTPGAATQLAEALETVMAQRQLYLNPELTLPLLANALGVTSHQASELLNLHLGTGFYDYLNTYRLRHAEALLRDPSCELRIIDIAYCSGFNNKNSFYRLFRQQFSTTPTAFREVQQVSKKVLQT